MEKLLLDECVPQQLRHNLSKFETYTIAYMQWGGIKNGKLLVLAVQEQFDFLLTTDKSIYLQQNLEKFPIAIIVFDVVRIDAELIQLLLPQFKKNIKNYEKHRAFILG